jgi:hypothetical protein
VGFRRLVIYLVLVGLLLPAAGAAQQAKLPPSPEEDPEAYEKMHHLDAIIYQKEMKEEYVKQRERLRKMREMEALDNQRRLVKRQMLDIHCTWKRPSGKTLTKVFKKRVAPSCDAAIGELSSDLSGPLTADCKCTGASPTEESP